MRPRVPTEYLALNSADAQRLGIADGDSISLRHAENGRAVSLLARVSATDGVPEGVALLPRDLGPASADGQFTATVEKA
jgi:anaerobic selenocysteine-containing dehydrogenase